MSMIWTAYALSESQVTSIKDDESLLGELLEELEEQDDADGFVEIDQSWNGIFWLLTGQVESAEGVLGDAILGGEALEEEFGYGPPKLLSPERVVAVARALEGIDAETLRARFDAEAMRAAGVYPEGIWSEAGIFDEFIAPNHRDVQRFYTHAASTGSWVLQLLA